MPRKFRKHLAHSSSNERSWTRNGDICVVNVLEDVIGTCEYGDEAWHLLEYRTLPLSLDGLPSFRENPSGGLDDNRDDAARLALLIEHWGVIEMHPDLFGPAAPIKGQFLVFVGKRATRQTDSHNVVIEVRDLRPALSHFGAEQHRMARTSKYRIGIVVYHDAIFPPQKNNRYV